MIQRLLVTVALVVVTAGCSAAAAPSAPPATTGGWHLLSPSPAGSGPSGVTGAVPSSVPSASVEPSAEAPTSTPKPKPKPTTAPVAATGTRISVKSQAFSVMLPKAWAAIDVDGKSVDAGVKRLLDLTGNLTTADQAKRVIAAMRDMLPGGVKFIAIKPSTFDLKAQSIDAAIILRATTEGASLNRIETLNVAQFAVMGSMITNLQHHQVKLANGLATWFSYDQRALRPDGTARVGHITMYMLVHGDYEYAVVFSTLVAPSGAGLKEFATIAGSLKFSATSTTNG